MAAHVCAAETHVPEVMVESVRLAVQTTFESFFGEEPSCDGSGEREVLEDGIVGVISFVGQPSWTMLLGLPRATAGAVGEVFVGCEIDFESSDMGDVVGEMANIIAGDAVARLDEAGIVSEMSVPTVTRGRDLEMLPPEGADGVRLSFGLPQGVFWVEVVLPEGQALGPARPRCAVCGR